MFVLCISEKNAAAVLGLLDRLIDIQKKHCLVEAEGSSPELSDKLDCICRFASLIDNCNCDHGWSSTHSRIADDCDPSDGILCGNGLLLILSCIPELKRVSTLSIKITEIVKEIIHDLVPSLNLVLAWNISLLYQHINDVNSLITDDLLIKVSIFESNNKAHVVPDQFPYEVLLSSLCGDIHNEEVVVLPINSGGRHDHYISFCLSFCLYYTLLFYSFYIKIDQLKTI